MAGVGGVHSACMARSFWLFLLASRPSLSTPFVLASLLRPCPQRTTIQPTQATFLSTRTEFRHTLVFQRKQGSFIRRKTTSMVAAAKLEAPASERNKDPIWNVLKTFLVSSKVSQKTNSDNTAQSPVRVLEIAAGTGVHTQYFCQKLLEQQEPPSFRWYPTDPDPACRASQEAYIAEIGQPDLSNYVSKPLPLTLNANGIVEQDTKDTLYEKVDDGAIDLIININMIHISKWSATIGLMRVAGELLKDGGRLYLYGPYRVGGTCVESNLRFEEWLKAKDPDFGVRNLEDVIQLAKDNGLVFEESIEMPANNLSVWFRKSSST